MGINQQYQHLCKRWLEKAKQYDEVINASSFSKERCEALIDKFFTLYVVYNALYNELNASSERDQENKQNKKLREEQKAVETVISNALYNEFNASSERDQENKRNKKLTEEQKAVENVISSVTAKKLLSKLSEDPAACRSMTKIEEIMKEGINSRSNPYGDLRICYHASGIYDKRGDNNLKYKFSQKDQPDIYVQGILEFIYHIRCNLFHGKKEINAIQEKILFPSVILLEKIVNIVYDELTRRF